MSYSKRIREKSFNEETIDYYIKSLDRFPANAFQISFCKKIIKKYGDKKDLRILDLGTGTGKILIYLSEKISSWELTGIDISEKMIDIAKNNSKNRNLNIIWTLGDVEDLRYYDGKFDLILSHFSFHEYSNSQKVIENMIKLSDKGDIEIVDLLRPNSLFEKSFSKISYLYEKNIKKLFLDSLNSSYTLEELCELFNNKPIDYNIKRKFINYFELSGRVLDS